MTWRSLISRLFRYFRNRHLADADAEDCTNETMFRMTSAYRVSRPELFDEPLPRDTEALAFRNAGWVLAQWHRKQRPTVPLDKIDPAASEPATTWGVPPALACCWELLSPERQELIRLMYGEEMTYAEIAERTGEPLNTLRQRHYQAMLVLRDCATEHGLGFWDCL